MHLTDDFLFAGWLFTFGQNLGNAVKYQHWFDGFDQIIARSQTNDDPELTTCNRLPGQASVWYEFSIPIDSDLTVVTKGSDHDTMLAVWTSTRGNLTMIGCNDDVGYVGDVWDPGSLLTVPVTADTTYYIEVSTYNGKIDANGASASELQSKPFKLTENETTAYGLQGETGLTASEFGAHKTEIDNGGTSVIGLQGERPGDELSAQFWSGQLKLNFKVTSPFLADVDVYIGGVKMNPSPYSIPPGGRVYPRYGIDDGPVQVVSTNGVSIFASERSKCLESFNEILGIASDQLTTEYWFTTLDDLGMDTELVISRP